MRCDRCGKFRKDSDVVMSDHGDQFGNFDYVTECKWCMSPADCERRDVAMTTDNRTNGQIVSDALGRHNAGIAPGYTANPFNQAHAVVEDLEAAGRLAKPSETKSGQDFGFTEAQVEAATLAYRGHDSYVGYAVIVCRECDERFEDRAGFEVHLMRAALVAAQGAASQDGALNPDDMSIMNGYLVLSVNEHTCGTGPDGHYGAHEPGCGYEPLVNLAEIPGYPADAASAMDRVNRLHQTVLRGNSMLGEELESWCAHCNIPYPCHTMQALAPVQQSSTVDEDALAEVIWQEQSDRVRDGYVIHTRETARSTARTVAEWLKEQGR